jgi:hypothetical protein
MANYRADVSVRQGINEYFEDQQAEKARALRLEAERNQAELDAYRDFAMTELDGRVCRTQTLPSEVFNLLSSLLEGRHELTADERHDISHGYHVEAKTQVNYRLTPFQWKTLLAKMLATPAEWQHFYSRVGQTHQFSQSFIDG